MTPLEQRTVVDWIAERFVAYEREAPALYRQCQEELEQLDGIDLEMAIESCDHDPSVLFDLDHPFPENRVIAERLQRRFGMRTHFFADLRLPIRYELELRGYALGTEDGRVSEFVVCERPCTIRRGETKLHEFKAKARLAWAHKVRSQGPAGGSLFSSSLDIFGRENMAWLRRRLDDLYPNHIHRSCAI